MVTWYSLRPKDSKQFSFSLKELENILLLLAKFHYENLGYKQNEYPYYEQTKLNNLREYRPTNKDRYHYLDNIFKISSVDPDIESTYLYTDDHKGTKRKVAERNLKTLQRINPIFNEFEIHYNYNY